MKIRFLQKRKLKAATATRRMPRMMEEGDGKEPSMSFGRAIIVVLVLHLVAVAAICTFTGLQSRNLARQQAASRTAKDASPSSAPAAVATAAAQSSATQDTPPRVTAPASTPVKQTASAVSSTPAASSQARDSGGTYTVAKGDTPVSIAKKLHVNYDDLLKLNKITDPKKLKIGQKLRIPTKKKATPTTQVPLDDEEQMS